jgi:hypothetical protein
MVRRELQTIEEFYGYKRARRSGVLLINHIHEGLVVLNEIGASEDAEKAFCLHPIFQADADLAVVGDRIRVERVKPWVMVLVMEYRLQANAWLSDKVSLLGRDVVCIGKPSCGPLPEVRDMLIADKVQNYKDFLTYHAGTHARSRELDHYFRFWLQALGISIADFGVLCKKIDESKTAAGASGSDFNL